jgi:hypothetical protein
MNRTFSYLIVLAAAATLFAAGLAALPVTAEPAEDSYIFLPLVNSPLVPVDQYETDFKDGIGTWKAVRWHKDADYDLTHNAGCVGGRCEFLDVAVKNDNSYVIASPLIAGPERSFKITFHARLQDRQDKHQYGAIFSADAGGAPCPGDNADRCFNRYYEFLVRYRDSGGEKYLEYRIRRIDSHDSNNVEIGEDLVEWTRAEGVNPEDWNKWEIRVRASGHIYVYAENREQPAYTRDNKFLDQRFFGLVTRTSENKGAYTHFDNFKIEADD